MNTQEHLFGLMAIAEEHQAAVKAAIDALSAERQLLGQQSDAHSKQLRALTNAAMQALGDLQNSLREVMRTVVARSVEHTSRAVTDAFDTATKPVLKQLAEAAGAVDNAHHRLRTTMTRFAWRWLAVLAASSGGMLIAIWCLSMAMIEWQRYQVDSLREEREVLTVEVAKLNATAVDFEKRGGRAELATCGKPGRLCVRVDKNVAFGEERDFFVIKAHEFR